MFELHIVVNDAKLETAGIDLYSFKKQLENRIFESHFEKIKPGCYHLDDEKYSEINAICHIVNSYDDFGSSVVPYLSKFITVSQSDGLENGLAIWNKNNA